MMSGEALAEEPNAGEPLILDLEDSYPVNPPFGFVGIERDHATGRTTYVTLEPVLGDQELRILDKIKQRLFYKMDIPIQKLEKDADMEEYLRSQVSKYLKNLGKNAPEDSEEKLIYYLKTDLLGYGRIDLLMRDPNIEDISCNGVDTPIYVWHRDHESIPTTISYETDRDLKAIVTRLAYRAGQQISVAHPILEGTLPEGYRIHLTLSDVSKRGATFTIRKYRAEPFTIVDLINLGTLSAEIAAYLWVMVENLRSIMICGATASGKTSLLNAICTFIKPEVKVVTIEEVRELRLHENWIPMVTRPSFLPAVQNVTPYDLLKSALRQRPEYIIVGEVRGEEAYTLFQSMAVGHGGLCTIHAEGFDSAIKRLVSKPMSIPEMMIPMMNIIVHIGRVKVGGSVGRRVQAVGELIGGTLAEGGLQVVRRFEWEPSGDTFVQNETSVIHQGILGMISTTRHVPMSTLREEQSRRKKVLEWMARRDLKDYEEVLQVIRDYYSRPEETYEEARLWLERSGPQR